MIYASTQYPSQLPVLLCITQCSFPSPNFPAHLLPFSLLMGSLSLLGPWSMESFSSLSSLHNIRLPTRLLKSLIIRIKDIRIQDLGKKIDSLVQIVIYWGEGEQGEYRKQNKTKHKIRSAFTLPRLHILLLAELRWK